MAPVLGATAVFTVTAVKLPWEGRDKRRGDENNGLSCSLQTSIVVGEKRRCVCVCLCWEGGVVAQGGGSPEG